MFNKAYLLAREKKGELYWHKLKYVTLYLPSSGFYSLFHLYLLFKIQIENIIIYSLILS